MIWPDEYVNKIICGDCLEVMKGIPDNSVDMVFSSPPFKDEDVDGDYWEVYDKWFSEMWRVTKNCMAIIHSATKMNTLAQKYPPTRWMIWGKGIVCYAWRFNPILVYQKNGYKVNKYIYTDTFGITPVAGKKKIHPYQDPADLYYEIIKMFQGCDLILDPFCGFGAAAMSSILNNRNFIGIDISQSYCNLAQRRIADVMLMITDLEMS